MNYARYADPELDRMIDAADLATDRAEQVRRYADVQRRVVDAVPWILLWYPDDIAVASARAGPFALGPGAGFRFVRSLTLQ